MAVPFRLSSRCYLFCYPILLFHLIPLHRPLLSAFCFLLSVRVPTVYIPKGCASYACSLHAKSDTKRFTLLEIHTCPDGPSPTPHTRQPVRPRPMPLLKQLFTSSRSLLHAHGHGRKFPIQSSITTAHLRRHPPLTALVLFRPMFKDRYKKREIIYWSS